MYSTRSVASPFPSAHPMDRRVVTLDNNRPARTYFSRRGSFRQECPTNRELPCQASPNSRGDVGLSRFGRIWGRECPPMRMRSAHMAGILSVPASRANAACPLFGVKRIATPVVRGGGRGALHRCPDSNGSSLLGKRKMKRSLKDSVRKTFGIAAWSGENSGLVAACGMWGSARGTPCPKINHPNFDGTSSLQPKHRKTQQAFTAPFYLSRLRTGVGLVFALQHGRGLQI